MEQTNQLDRLSELITLMRIDIGKLDTKIDSFKDLHQKVHELEKQVTIAEESNKSAHHRLNRMENNQTWLWRTTIGALIIGAIGLLWKGFGA